MEATILDLRYHMKDVLQALARREPVQVLSHGHLKGVLFPPNVASGKRVANHSFFGMNKDDAGSVEDVMRNLRKPRSNAV